MEKKKNKREIHNLVDFISRAREIHGDKYDYSKAEYKNVMTPVIITCPEHGEFLMPPNNHVNQKQGCPKCAGKGLTTADWITRFKSVHGDKYDYSKVEYVGNNKKVCIICPEHGEFWQTPAKHYQKKQGCPKCANEAKKKNCKLTREEFIEKAKAIHGNLYDYSLSKYDNSHTPLDIICPKHGVFQQRANDHLNGHGCPICGNAKPVSDWEKEVREYISSLGIKVEYSIRGILDNNMEIDIYLPEHKIGIECDGLYWHSDEYKDDNYHLLKTKNAKEKGIRLYHIFEDEWNSKKEIIKDIIRIKLDNNRNLIYARKCVIEEISYAEKRDFINKNHIQGDCVSKINLGLIYEGKLVSAMTFGKRRINLGGRNESNSEYELIRFCTEIGTTVIGGAAKLFMHFVHTYKPSKIISYCDKRLFDGNIYERLGMEYIGDSRPNYYYVLGKKRENRFLYRKSVLVNEGFDKSKSERDIMKERGIHRIYDCGCKVFKINFN